jgi:hypothetical protein
MRRSSAATIAVSRLGGVVMRSLRASRRRGALVVAGLLVCGLLATGAGAADPIFVHGAGSPLAVQAPHSEAAADLNGDGKVDLAVASYATDSVAIFAGNGAGGFAAPISVAVGDGPLSLAVADLNRDGHADLTVANSESDNLSILLGNGSGSFQAAGPPVALSDAPWYVSVGDVNRDRRPDVVVAHVGSGGQQFVASRQVSVLLGDGAGGFTHAAGSPIDVGPVPYGIEIADFNSDHTPDLAIATQFDRYLHVLQGDGTGRFVAAPGSPIDVGSGPTWVVAADFNGDRNNDLAVAVGSGTVPILLGDGAGRFTHAPDSPIALPLTPHNMRAADFDRDGTLDLGVDTLGRPNFGVPPSFRVLLGGGDGRFQPAGGTTNGPVGSGPLSMAVGDFDADGKPDVAVGNHFVDTVSVLLNRSVTPADAIAALGAEVSGSDLEYGLRVSLVAKLRLAERTAGVEGNRAACKALSAFVAEVEAAATSGKLTEAVALAWIGEADAIRADLDCGG